MKNNTNRVLTIGLSAFDLLKIFFQFLFVDRKIMEDTQICQQKKLYLIMMRWRLLSLA